MQQLLLQRQATHFAWRGSSPAVAWQTRDKRRTQHVRRWSNPGAGDQLLPLPRTIGVGEGGLQPPLSSSSSEPGCAMQGGMYASSSFPSTETAARMFGMRTSHMPAQQVPAPPPQPQAPPPLVLAQQQPAFLQSRLGNVVAAATAVAPAPPAVMPTPAATPTLSLPPAPAPASAPVAGPSAPERLAALQAAQAASAMAVSQSAASSAAQSRSASAYYSGAPRTIDVRMYDQVVAAHARLSQRLSDSNTALERVEEELASAYEDVAAAYELLKQISMEFGTTSRLAAGTAAAVRFGVDPQEAVAKVTKLQERLATLEQAVLEQRRSFAARVVRRVPLEWTGVASEVRVMGDFDDWTTGIELSAEQEATDSVFSSFKGELSLRPGTYRVKFMVDGQWRLAGAWPTADDGSGNTTNVLVVAVDT